MKKSIIFSTLAFFALSALSIGNANAQIQQVKSNHTSATVTETTAKPSDKTVVKEEQKKDDCCNSKKVSAEQKKDDCCNSKKVSAEQKKDDCCNSKKVSAEQKKDDCCSANQAKTTITVKSDGENKKVEKSDAMKPKSKMAKKATTDRVQSGK